MSDEKNKYYKKITNKHTSLIINLLISSINIYHVKTIFFSCVWICRLPRSDLITTFTCNNLYFLILYKQPSLIVEEEQHHRVRNRIRELSPERGRVVVLKERRLCLDDPKPYNL